MESSSTSGNYLNYQVTCILQSWIGGLKIGFENASIAKKTKEVWQCSWISYTKPKNESKSCICV